MAVSSMHPDQDVAVILLFTGRFLHGLADSLGVSPAIIMVSEVSTVKLRGIFMNSVSIAACSGIPLAYIIGRCVRKSIITGLSLSPCRKCLATLKLCKGLANVEYLTQFTAPRQTH